ncbi:MAG: hypothetical protein D6706_19785 [Chloroflexi bacterium]|nr:MAG: hypothetical protein D6706_19785 [Chloroflexota bacterium]
MQFTSEVAWTLADFVIFGGLLAGTGIAFELVFQQGGDSDFRWGAGVALVTAFVLVWVNGAVGIVGSEGNVVNLMFLGVVGIGATGAFVARFRPRGMALAMIFTAVVQALVGGVVLVWGLGSSGGSWPFDVLFLTGFFVFLWLFSAWLFWRASKE